jgi:hypothetical protein
MPPGEGTSSDREQQQTYDLLERVRRGLDTVYLRDTFRLTNEQWPGEFFRVNAIPTIDHRHRED